MQPRSNCTSLRLRKIEKFSRLGLITARVWAGSFIKLAWTKQNNLFRNLDKRAWIHYFSFRFNSLAYPKANASSAVTGLA